MKDLTKKTVKELRDIAKDLNIVGRWDMTKDELVKAITEASSWSDDDITFETDCIINGDDTNQSEGSQKLSKNT